MRLFQKLSVKSCNELKILGDVGRSNGSQDNLDLPQLILKILMGSNMLQSPQEFRISLSHLDFLIFLTVSQWFGGSIGSTMVVGGCRVYNFRYRTWDKFAYESIRIVRCMTSRLYGYGSIGRHLLDTSFSKTFQTPVSIPIHDEKCDRLIQ